MHVSTTTVEDEDRLNQVKFLKCCSRISRYY